MRQWIASLALASVALVGLAPTADAATTPKVTMALSTTTLTAGQYLTVTGKRSPALAAQPVTLQRQTAPGRWEALTSTHPTSAGAFSLSYRLTTPGTNVLRVLSPNVGKTQNAAASPARSVTVYRWIRLVDLTDASCSSNCASSGAQVDGTGYGKTITLSVYGGSRSEWWNLSRKCTRFATVVGQDDSDRTAAAIVATASADSVDLWSGSVTLGHPATVDVDISGYLRLTLSASDAEGDARIDWADARVLCAK